MGWGLAVWLQKAFRDSVQQAALLAPLDLGEKSGFLWSHPGLQPLSTGAGEKPCNINVSETAFEHPGGFNYADTRTFSETDVQMLLSLLNPFKIKIFVG